MSIKTIESFLRYVRNDTDVVAVKIANDALDQGGSIDQLLTSESGLRISLTANRDGGYEIHICCIAGSDTNVVGDGGSWQVVVDPDGNVIRAISKMRVIYD